MGKCQEDAGILTADGKLTPIAKTRFIERCNKEFLLGTVGLDKTPLSFTCGPKVEPSGLDISDESKYAQFYENILGTYEKIANALNLQGGFIAPPIVDPIALGFAINAPNIPKFKLDDYLKFLTLPLLPTLAIKLGFPIPVDLAVKFPALINIPKLPEIKIPDLDPKLLPDLLKFNISFAENIPKLLLKLFDPTALLKILLPILKLDISGLCKFVFSANIFGPQLGPNPITQIVAYKVLTEKTGECLLIAAVGSTLGSAPAGLTGTLGRDFGYTPPEQELPKEKTPRERLIEAALKGDGLSYQNTKEKYISFLFPYEYENDKKKADAMAKNNSSCALYARAVLGFAGASDPWFTTAYKSGTAISQLKIIGDKLKAIKRNTLSDELAKANPELPPLKKGDIVLIAEPGVGATDNKNLSQHILIILEDHPGGVNKEPIKVIEGGQRVEGSNIGTAIKKNEYFISVAEGKIKLGKNRDKNPASAAPRTVRLIWDGEKMLE